MIATSSARDTVLETAGQENNPFVAWNNIAASATLGGTSTLTDGAAANAVTGTTYDFWLPDVAATTASFNVQFGASRTVSFAAIAAHNLADYGASIRCRRSSDGSSWTDAGGGEVTPTDNGPIAFRMAQTGQDYEYWQFYVTGLTAGDDIAIGVAFFGDDLVIPQRVYSGFAPVITPTEIELQANESEGGHLLGSSIVRKGSSLSLELSHLTPGFIRGPSWKAFQTSFNEAKPAFLAWRPEKYPEDIHYIWRSGGTIRPVNMGVLDYMAASFSARVYEP